MTDTPLVSIIIVNLNGRKNLEQCLKYLMEISYKNFEIILVDNNSTDDSIEFVKNTYPSIMIIKLDKNRGFAEPNNIGARISKGEFLLFLNNDTKVTTNFITELIKIAKQDQQIAICQSMLLKPNGSVDSSGDYIDSIGVSFSSKKKIENVKEILSARGASMLIRKKVFDELGGFDEKFFASFEDVDLGWRTWIRGYKVLIVPKSIVYHIGGKTVDKLRSQVAFHGMKNQLSLRITNFESSNAIKSLVLSTIIYGSKIFPVWLNYKFKGTTSFTATKYEEKIFAKPSFKIILKSLIWILKNQKYLAKKRKVVNSNRIRSTRELQEKKVILP